MKTMQQGESIVRAAESQVNHYLRSGYQFCPKSVWKTQVRDAKRATPAEKKAKKKAKKAKS